MYIFFRFYIGFINSHFEKNFLMETKKYIFCALDFSELEKTISFTKIIKDHIGGIKLGLEFFTKNGIKGVEELKKIGLPIFLDLKLHDIPNTVKQSLKNVLDLSPNYVTVHLSGGLQMLEELKHIKKKTKIIGVSMLTNLDEYDLKRMGFNNGKKSFVDNLVKIGVKAGIDGIVSSPREVKYLKKKYRNLIFVTPGIRLPNHSKDDQKRIETPRFAVQAGSNILVIGRPITKSKNPLNSIEKIIENINYGK